MWYDGGMEEEIKPGDIVQLKSGGPLMTVEREHMAPDDLLRGTSVRRLTCVWFVKASRPAMLSSMMEGDEGEFRRQDFCPRALQVVKK